MALVSLTGAPLVTIGPGWGVSQSNIAATNITMDAANEATIFIGNVITSDGGSHTIDTTGSSSIGWRTATTTFANGGTTLKVGIAAVDTANGPPGRAVNVANVITFDVAAVFTGGAGVTTDAWQTSVPTTGTKTIANGDLVAICMQMTARAGVDSVLSSSASAAVNRPTVTSFVGGSYVVTATTPNAIITFSDGATGHIGGSDIFSTLSSQTWNSGSAKAEYGQLYNLPFPMKVYGIYGWLDITADCDVILYSDPLGTPIAEKTVSIDANTITNTGNSRHFVAMFSSPYTTTANQNIGAVFKPGGSNVSARYKTLASATHRVADPFGTTGYAISRASGAFADTNSSLDHHYVGLLVGAFDAGGGGFPVLGGPFT